MFSNDTNLNGPRDIDTQPNIRLASAELLQFCGEAVNVRPV